MRVPLSSYIAGSSWVGMVTLIHREVLRFLRRPRNTFIPPLITNVLYFAVFGVVLGGRIGPIEGISYIQFVLPGLVVLGTISNAFENASFSIFHGRWNEYIHEVLTSPLPYREMVMAYVIASVLRGLIIAILIGLIGVAFTSVPMVHPIYLAGFMVVIAVLFAGIGIVGGLWARDFDYLTVLNQFLIRPLVFFGGVFYSLSVLPPTWRAVSYLNPMVYMVNGVRYGMLGYTEVNPALSLGVLSGTAIGILALNVWLFKRGFGLRE